MISTMGDGCLGVVGFFHFAVSQISLTSTWKEVKRVVKDDPRFSKFSSSDRVRAVAAVDVLSIVGRV